MHLLFAEVCHVSVLLASSLDSVEGELMNTQLCERKVKAIEIFWEARIRACKKCTQNE